MTSKLVVNTIESDTGISSVSFASSISMSSTSKFFFSAAGIDIGADTNINRPEAGVLGFNINGGEKVRITSNGRVNIGQASDVDHTLCVAGTDNTTSLTGGHNQGIQLQNKSTTDGTYSQIEWRTSSGGRYARIAGIQDNANGNGGQLVFLTETSGGTTTERLRIASDGKVTTSTTGLISHDFGTTSSTGAYLHFDLGANGANIGYMGPGNHLVTGAAVSDLAIRSGANLVFSTSGATERLRITSAGQMVMGATTSRAKFEIKDNGYTSTSVLQRISADDHNPYALIIANDTVNTNSNSGLQFFVNDQGMHYIRARGSSTASNNDLLIASQNIIYFNSGSSESERLRITSGGDVGINGGSDVERKVDIVTSNGNSVLIRPNTGGDNSQGNANVVNNSLIFRMPYGQNAGSSSNAGARIGIVFTGRNDGSGYVDNPSKSASIYGISEDDSAGYTRKMGMGFFTSPFDASQTEKMRISNEGYVTTPLQPAFAARLGSNIDITSNTFTDIVFSVQEFDNSGSYNTSNGRFTVPVAGKYYFGVQIYAGFNGTGVRVMHANFRVNGTSVAQTDMFGGASNHGGTHYHPTAVGHAFLSLNKNDYVTWNTGGFSHTGGQAILYASTGNRFFGYLVG